MRTSTFASTLALLLLPALACGPADSGDQATEAGAPTPQATEPPQYETTQVADGVWRFRWVGHNGLFVQTPEGVIVVDPISTEAAAVFAEEVRAAVGDVPLQAVVYSHRDADHATGAQVIRDALGPDAPIVAHENALAPLTAQADPDLPAPTVTYRDRHVLTPDSRPVELHHFGPSHSDDQSVVLIPDVGLAFAVDFVAHDRVGYRDLPGWHVTGQIESISRLSELEFETIVFGHGPNGDKESVSRQSRYWESLRDAVSQALQEGLSEDQAAESIQLGEFATWDRYDDWFTLNVRGMYRILSAEG